MKRSALIPEDDLLLKNSIEAGASQEALAKGNKRIINKRKGESICTEYYRTRRRKHSESFNFSDLSFFDRCNYFQDHVTLNHEAQIGDVMFSYCLANNLGSIATTNLVDKSADRSHESDQNDCINGFMREDGLYKHTENVCYLLRDNLMDFFDPGMELADDIHMHRGDSDNSSAITDVEYASPPDSCMSFSNKECMICILNTEDTIDDIPDSQLLDSPESILEDSSFDGNQQDVCHWETNLESSISHIDSVQLNEGNVTCILNTEDPEIPCNDDICLLICSSPSARPKTATDSIDPASSFTQSQMVGPDLSPESDSANPHVGNTFRYVSMDYNPSISDHNNSDSDSDVPCFLDIENPEIPCNGNIFFPNYSTASVRLQTATDSIDRSSSFTQSQMDGTDLSSEYESANSHNGNTLKSVSMDHNLYESDHNNHSFLDTEDPEIPCSDNHQSPVRPQAATDSIDPPISFTQSQMDGPDYAHPHVDNTPKSIIVDHNPCILDHNNSDNDGDLPCFPDIVASILKLDFDYAQKSSITNEVNAHPHVDNTPKSLTVDHNPCILDHNNSDSDGDLPCFPDIEALILKLDFEYAQESWITNEVKRHKYKHSNRTINRLKQSSSPKAMLSLGAFAVFYSHNYNYYIKKTKVTIGRSTDDTEVDIDLRKETHATMISRQQATIKMETDGTFTLKNIGKGLILMEGRSISHGQVAALCSGCLIQIRGMDFMFEINDRHVRWYLDNIIKNTQGKFTTFEWSP